MELLNKLNNFVKKTDESYYVKILFDPVQNFAVYSVSPNEIDDLKKQLKEIGAKSFRVVKTKFITQILCFKLTEENSTL